MLRKITLLSGLFVATPLSAHIGSHETIGLWHWLTEPSSVIGLGVLAALIAIKTFGSSS